MEIHFLSWIQWKIIWMLCQRPVEANTGMLAETEPYVRLLKDMIQENFLMRSFIRSGILEESLAAGALGVSPVLPIPKFEYDRCLNTKHYNH